MNKKLNSTVEEGARGQSCCNKINMNNYQIQQNKNTINLYQEKFKKTKEGIQIFTDKSICITFIRLS